MANHFGIHGSTMIRALSTHREPDDHVDLGELERLSDHPVLSSNAVSIVEGRREILGVGRTRRLAIAE